MDAKVHGIQSIAFGNGRFVAVGAAGLVYTSPDGESWTDQSSRSPIPRGYAFQSVTFGHGLFVAVAENGTIQLSTITPPTYQWIRGAAYGGGQFVAVGEGLIIARKKW